MGTWVRTVTSDANDFGLAGCSWNGKLFVTGYGSGSIISYNPATNEHSQGDEAVFSLVPFKGSLFAPSEQNSRSGQTRIWQRTTAGGWVARPVRGYASYFMTANDISLVFSTTNNILNDGTAGSTIDIYETRDGVNMNHLGNTGAWIWVPIFYKNQLYVLGHNGSCYDDSTAGAVKWNGAGWSTVSALSGFAKEWQACCTQGNYLFLGNTGQTSERRDDTSLASVYRYDGSACVLVKNVPGYSEVSAIRSIQGVLFASFCSGFKYNSNDYATPGDCQIWLSTDDGATWTHDTTLPQPSVYDFVEFGGVVHAIGGGGGARQTVYGRVADGMYPPPGVTPPTPTPVPPSPTGTLVAPADLSATVLNTTIKLDWTAPTTVTGMDGYEIMTEAIYTGATAPVQLMPFINVKVPDSAYDFTPPLAGSYKFRIRTCSYGVDARTERNVRPGTVLKYKVFSIWSEWTTPIQYSTVAALPTPPAPTVVMHTTDDLAIGFVPLAAQPTSVTEVYYQTTSSGVITKYTTAGPGVTSIVFLDPSGGETYKFYVKYVHGTNVSALSAGTTFTMPSSHDAPTGVAASFTSQSTVELSWQDNSIGESVFDIERTDTAIAAWHKIAEVPANTTSFIDSSITNASRVQYRVRARGGVVLSLYASSNIIPAPVPAFGFSLRKIDTNLKRVYWDMDISNWRTWNDLPAVVTIDYSFTGVSFTTYETLPVGSTKIWTQTQADEETAFVPYPDNDRVMYLRATAINGSGATTSLLLTVPLSPVAYTAPTPPVYDPGTPYGETLVWGRDGAGQADYALSGLAVLRGLVYAATPEVIGTLDQQPREAEIITQPLGDSWYGGKTIYVAELEASTNRDVTVMVGSRSDYKDVSYSYGREVPFHKTGKTGYIKSGNEFEVRIKWASGYAHYLKIFGGRLWAKLTKQAQQTVPFFYGKRGYDPGKGAK